MIPILAALFLSMFFSMESVKTKEDLLNTGCNVLLDGQGFGTGNFINNHKHPYVLTCRHVVAIPDQSDVCRDGILIVQQKIDNKDYFVKGKVVVYSRTIDFAIIELDNVIINSSIAKYTINPTRVGDKIFCFGLIGMPGKLFLHEGAVSQKNVDIGKEVADIGYLSIIPGTSGATVFNSDGKGIGIAARVNKIGGSQCFFVRIGDIIDCLDKSNIEGLSGILDGSFNGSILSVSKDPVALP